MKKILQNLANWLVYSVICVFLIGFLSPLLFFGLSCIDIRLFSAKVRFPLGLPAGIAVDSKERIYCVLHSYRRVQVYDNEGRFLRGWSVFVPSGGSNILIDGNNRIHVKTATVDGHYAVFSSEGALLEKRSKDFYEKKWSGFLETKDNAGNIYRIKDAWFLPKIVKISPSGEEIVIVSDPFYLWLMKAPFPTGAFILAAMAIGGTLELRKWIKKKKHRNIFLLMNMKSTGQELWVILEKKLSIWRS